MSAALTGPSSALGREMQLGIKSYFKFVNDNGGVQGKLLEFIVRDDGYEPERAGSNMRALIDNDGVLAVLGNVGTPTAIVTVPIAQESKTLLFGAFSGGGVLRPIPASRYIINYRPSYAEEMSEIVNGLLSVGIKPEEVAFFTQRDGYGHAAYSGAINAFHLAGIADTEGLIHGQYTRNTLNVEDAVADILDASLTPKVIIMAGGYAPSAKFINLLQQELPEIWFINVSFVGSHLLKQALGTKSNHVVVVKTVPNLDSSLPIVSEYERRLTALDDSLLPNGISLEGYIVAKIFHLGLLSIKGDINKESIIDGLESLRNIDIGVDFLIYYDEQEHQAIHKLWLTCLSDANVSAFHWPMMNDGCEQIIRDEG
ncbi:MAG: ligand-binding receptor [Gammaproteobacteria bacterium]|nr:MAG: ligand-binding receptor [Gammaproteobacteria bacterium]